MRQKGFATIFGLCLILVIALIVKGIQESETNHAYETANFQAEVELQNAADSALVEVADSVLSGAETLPVKPEYANRQRSYYQREFTVDKISETLGDITVSVWGEEATLMPYKVNHSTKIARRSAADKPVYIFFSMAQANHGGRKLYRRAFAYVDKDSGMIHFMDLQSSEYTFNTKPWKKI